MKRRYYIEITKRTLNTDEAHRTYYNKIETVNKVTENEYNNILKWNTWGYIEVYEYDYRRNRYYMIQYCDNEKSVM